MNVHYTPLFPSTPTTLAPFKIIPAAHVTADSGTGLVHCAPAHGAEDYLAFKHLSLLRPQTHDTAQSEGKYPIVSHVDGEGKFDKSIMDIIGVDLGKRLIGLEVLGDGAKVMREVLVNERRVVSEKEIRHRYPYDWKTGKPVIVRWAFSTLSGR